MAVSSVCQDGQVTIHIDGHFGFGDYRAFRGALHLSSASAPRYRVELARVDSADSSALGMLLVLLDHAGGDPARVVLAGSRGQMARLLQLTGVGERFRLE